MEFRESASAACRERYTENIKKDIIAFLNAEGGVIYLGVDSLGGVIGLENPDFVILRTANECYDAIQPDISGLLRYTKISADGKDLLKLSVGRGTAGPYFLSSKGLCPEGVYIRQGTSTIPMPEEKIRAMIRETDGESFEAQRSRRQDLTFAYASKEFVLQGITLDGAEMRALKMISRDGLYTNLALLLSDQCPYRIKTAVFRSDETTLLQESRVVDGSLLKQLRDTEEYLDLSNLTVSGRANTSASNRKGLSAHEQRDYPPEALREVLTNALLHREYENMADTLINIFENRMEVISYGGLPGITMEDVKLGLTVCRNPHLAEAFARLQLAPNIGSGMRRIQTGYGQSGRKPVFYSSTNVFKVLLPNQNVNSQEPANGRKNSAGKAVPCGIDINTEGTMEGTQSTAVLTDERARAILQYLQEFETASRSELQQAAGVSPAGTVRLLRRLCDAGLVEAQGRGKCTRYRIGMHKVCLDI